MPHRMLNLGLHDVRLQPLRQFYLSRPYLWDENLENQNLIKNNNKNYGPSF